MKIRAKTSFCGALTMAIGEVRECSDKSLLADLFRAGYIEPVGDTAAPAEPVPAKNPAPAPKKNRRTKKS